MSRRALILAATLFAVLGLAVAACGSDDDGEAAEPPAEQPAEPAPPAEEPPAEPPAEEPPAEAAEIPLATDPGGALAFDQTELSAAPGTVSIVLTNDSPVPHNVAIEGGGEVLVEGEVFQGGGTRTTTADLEAGEYVFFCSVPGHREAGMEGTLTVG